MAQIPELRGQFTIGTANDSFGMNAQTAALTAGTYYIAGDDAESNGLIDDLQTQMRKFTGQGSTNVSYSSATGLITAAMTAGANIEFDDSALAAILGFSSTTQATSDEHTGNQVPRYVWRPTRGLSGHPVDVNTFWNPKSSTVVGRSVDGTTYSREGTITYDATLMFDKLPAADVVTPGTGTVYRDLQQFFEDVAAKGSLIRIYKDRATTSSTSWVEGLWGSEDDEELGSFQDYASRHIKRWQSLWDVEIPLMKKV